MCLAPNFTASDRPRDKPANKNLSGRVSGGDDRQIELDYGALLLAQYCAQAAYDLFDRSPRVILCDEVILGTFARDRKPQYSPKDQ